MLHIGVGVSTKTLTVLKYNDAKLSVIAEIELKQTENILELLNANKIGISQSCGGFATCTTCRIIVTKGAEYLPAREELEEERAQERNFAPEERLACQVEISVATATDIEIIITDSNED
ncbi:MAG: 2Fe-2S iron-sulfur cluster-binding protein [Bdellovibrionota bacterium]